MKAFIDKCEVVRFWFIEVNVRSLPETELAKNQRWYGVPQELLGATKLHRSIVVILRQRRIQLGEKLKFSAQPTQCAINLLLGK